MRRQLTALLLVAVASSWLLADHHEEKQYFEVRQYRLKSAEQAEMVDAYLAAALAPALRRAGAGPVGIFRESQEQAQPIRLVIIPYDSIAAFAATGKQLAQDEQYQQQAAGYLSVPISDAPLVRVRSELLYAFDCMPKLKVPELTQQQDRIFELRIYESPTEGFGDLKVEMFNAGEVPIFLDSGIIPVFMGQALVGDLMPNLTYMTVYPDEAAKDKAWDNFRVHPDWKILSAVEKYKGTVSKIHKFDLVPVKGSQL